MGVIIGEKADDYHLLFVIITRMKINEILNYDKKINPETRARLAAYYTPLNTAKLMARDAIAAYLENLGNNSVSVEAFLDGNDDKVSCEFLKQLREVYFLDMAAGTGVLPYAYLLEIKRLLEAYHSQFALSDFAQKMTLNDIDNHSLFLFKDLIWQEFDFEFKGKLFSVDALLELRNQVSVQRILANGGFDIIMGNPPYLGERGNKELFKALKADEFFSPYYQARMDYYYFFIHQAIAYLAPKGVISYITPAYFTTADGADKLREHMDRECQFSVVRQYDDVFKTVASISAISFVLIKKNKHRSSCKFIQQNQEFSIDSSNLFGEDMQLRFLDNAVYSLLAKIRQVCTYSLADILEIRQGLVSGADRVSARILKQLPNCTLGEAIFVFDKNEVEVDEFLKPMIKNSDIKAYFFEEAASQFVLYSKGSALIDNSKWLNHLAKFKSVLEKRREVVSGAIPWYALQWPREERLFESPKIITPQRSRLNVFAYDERALYGSADIYYLLLREEVSGNIDETCYLKALTMYLNSSLVYFWLYYMGKRKGKMLELYKTPLTKIPVPDFDDLEIEDLKQAYDCYLRGEIKKAKVMAFELIKTKLSLNDSDWQLINEFREKMTIF